MQINGHDFPLFLGEIKGVHYRWFGITLRFLKKPSPSQVKKIQGSVPSYFYPVIPVIHGRMFQLGIGKITSKLIDEDVEAMRKLNNYSYTFYLKDFISMQQFDDDVVRWLNEIDSICPLQFAFRDETDDGKYRYQGGNWSHVSDEINFWREESAKHIETLLGEIAVDEENYRQLEEERRIFAYSVKALAKAHYLSLEAYPRLAEYVNSIEVLTELLKQTDVAHLWAIVKRETTGAYIDYMIVYDLESIFYDYLAPQPKIPVSPEDISRLLLLARFLAPVPDAWEICFTETYNLVNLVKAAIAYRNRELLHEIATFTRRHFCAESYVKWLGAQGWAYIEQKKYPEAIELYKIVAGIEFKRQPEKLDLSIYCNALWVLIKGNTGLPVQPALNGYFLEKCLPYALQNPAIYCNAANIYAEMEDFEMAYQYFLLTKQQDPASYKVMLNDLQTGESLAPFKKYLEDEKGMVF